MPARFKPLTRCWEGMQGTVRIGYKNQDGAFRTGEAFSWPDDCDLANAYVGEIDRNNQDVYFTPGVYDGEVKAANLLSRHLLWADLDRNVPGRENFDVAALKLIKPSLMWQTSHHCYQAVWVMPTPADDWTVADTLRVNTALTRFLRADPNGMSGAKFLRVPGSAHRGKAKNGTWDSDVAFRSRYRVMCGAQIGWASLLDVLSDDLSALVRRGVSTHTAESVLASAASLAQSGKGLPALARATRAQFIGDEPWDGDRSRLRWTQMGQFRQRVHALTPGELFTLMQGIASVRGMTDERLAEDVANHYRKWVQR